MSIIEINRENRFEYLPQILEIEACASYPLADDYFSLDHGSDYFEFFNRIGSYRYYIWKEKERVAAVICAILNQVPLKSNGRLYPAWYLCDLKVHPDYRGMNLPLKMMRRIFFPNYLRCRKGYLVSMNPEVPRDNRIVRLSKHFRWASSKIVQLELWSLDATTMLKAQPILEKHRGPVGYLSLQGIKDIVLASTNSAMPILHAQFGPKAKTPGLQMDSQSIHMFCSPSADKLNNQLKGEGLMPSSSASILAHRMHQTDWTWMLTSEI